MRQRSLTPKQLTALSTVNWAAVARIRGLSPATISKTLHGQRRNPMVRRIIAIAAGLKPEELWPELAKKAPRGKPWAA